MLLKNFYIQHRSLESFNNPINFFKKTKVELEL